MEDDHRLGQQLTASEFAFISNDHAIPIPNLAEKATEIQTKLCVGHLLGKIFGEHNTYECVGFRIDKIETPRYAETKGRLSP